MKRSDPQVLAKVILHAAQNALGVSHLAVSDCICSFSRDTRKIIRIIEAVEADTGCEMSLTSFAGSANIAQMGEVLAQGRTAAPLVVELKRGDGVPVFMVPGIASAVVELLDLAQAVETDGAIYALSFPGLDGLEKPIESVGVLAQRLHRLIVETVGVRKVHLVGYSAGGSIAVEVARLLGPSHVGFLGLVESPIHLRHWSLLTWLRFIARHRRKAFSRERVVLPDARDASAPGRRQPAGERRGWREIVSTASRKLVSLLEQRYGDVSSPSFLTSFTLRVECLPPGIQSVRDATIRAMASERPARFDGPATYFRTQSGDNLMCEPSRVWKGVLPNAEYIDVTGSHAGVMAQPHVSVLAREVSARLVTA